jgi:hypothetical protein
MFSDEKICPICNNTNQIYLDGGWPEFFFIEFSCEKCGLKFSYAKPVYWAFLSTFLICLFLFIFFYNYRIEPICWIGVILSMTLPYILIEIMIKGSIFDNYLKKLILKRVYKMMKKNKSVDIWGNQFKNLQKISFEEIYRKMKS